MAVTRGTLRLARTLRRAVGVEADQAVRTLTGEWVTAWDALAPAWTAAAADLVAEAGRLGHWPRPTDVARVGSAMAALQATEDTLTRLARSTATTAANAASRAVDADVDLEARIIASQAPATEREALLAHTTSRVGLLTREQDRDTVNLTVSSRIRTFAPDVIRQRVQGQITSTADPLPAETLAVVRRELIRGVEVGDNPRTAAARMVAQAQAGFNGGLARALNIARTETLDAYRGVSQAIHTANSDLVRAWQWLAELDRRVCPSCASLHGSVFPLSEPGPLDHQQGRCARLPVLASWAELGITTQEPPSAVPDGRAWFDQLPYTDQLHIMGPQRLAMLQSGQISWQDLSMRRINPGWRDSYVPTPVSRLRRQARTPPPPPAPPGQVAAGQQALDATPARLDTAGGTRLTRRQQAALRAYESAFYTAVNGQLRRGDVSPMVRRTVAAIDSVMAAAALTATVAVWRGIANINTVFGPAAATDLTGAEWVEHGYLSTTASAQVAAAFADPGTAQAVMRITAPAGVGAVRISGMGVGGQAELLLQRGLRLRVVADTGPGSTPRQLAVEVMR